MLEIEKQRLTAMLAQTINQKPYPVASVDGLAIAASTSPAGDMKVVFMMVLDQTPDLLKGYPKTPEEGMVIAAIAMQPAEVSDLVATLLSIPGVGLPKTEDEQG